VRPALSVTREFFPATEQPSSEFAAFRLGGSDSIPVAFLTDTDELRRHPFEINFGIPGQAPKVSQIQGTVGALKSVLENYRALLATGQNI
jgi:hypothetical protein